MVTILLIFFCVSALITYFFCDTGLSFYRQRYWKRADGLVLHVAFELEEMGGRVTRRTFAIPKIKYEFHVGKRNYRSTNVFTSEIMTSSQKKLNKWLSVYQVGQQVVVWYDQNDPKKCCLRKGIDFVGWAGLITGGLVSFLIFILTSIGLITMLGKFLAN